MKTGLNLIIAVLIYLIYSEVEFNTNVKEVYYSNALGYSVLLFISGFIRYYYVEFKELLTTKK